ncbi:MAG: DUF4388 domain-containing protein [Myxococcota bacterium]
MPDDERALVRIDTTGAAHPVGREASRQMRQRQGNLRLLKGPQHTLVLRQADADPRAWLTGEVTRPGILWDLIGIAGQGNWTGQLVVGSDACERSIFFERGSIVAASSTAERERLGEVLYRYGVLSAAQIQDIADNSDRERRFGETAVALGYLTRERLFDVIGKQAEEVVYATMLVSAGTFYYVESFDEERLPYRLNLSVQQLLMEGVRRMDEIELFRARIPSELHVPDVVLGAEVETDDEHHPVFAAIDGLANVEDIGRALGMGTFETTRALFQLLQRKAITLHPPRPTGALAIVTLFNQAMSFILNRVDEVGGGVEVREQLASFATASGVYDALFRDAGPRADGTLDAAKVAVTVEQLAGSDNATPMLGQWLYEYASFAMFIAEPLLRGRPSLIDVTAEGPASEGAAVSRRVAELLAPLAPESQG